MHILDLLRTIRPALSVGAISADLMSLTTEISALEENGVRLLHFDIMDGHFAPQLTIGPWFVKALKTKMLKDVHLMIENPIDAIPAYAAAGADIITVHADSSRHIRAALQRIGAQKNVNEEGRGIGRGVAINPSTPLCNLRPLLEESDIVTIVAINPGFSGQTFYKDTLERAARVRDMIATTGKKILLCIDGGVTTGNIGEVCSALPDFVVSGSAVFENHAVAKNIDLIHRALRTERNP
jgi:ribulose-phosphate 3-epimerase